MSATLSLWRCSHSNSMEKFSLSLEKRKKLFCLYYFSPRINIPQKTFKPTAKKGTEKTTFNQTFSRLGRFPFLHNSPRRPTLRHGETFFDWWILIRMKNKWRKRKASERYWRKIRRAGRVWSHKFRNCVRKTLMLFRWKTKLSQNNKFFYCGSLWLSLFKGAGVGRKPEMRDCELRVGNRSELQKSVISLQGETISLTSALTSAIQTMFSGLLFSSLPTRIISRGSLQLRHANYIVARWFESGFLLFDFIIPFRWLRRRVYYFSYYGFLKSGVDLHIN